MKRQKALVNVIYGYISFAFFMVFLSALGLLHPFTDIVAGIALLIACFYIGKYGKSVGQ